MRCSRWRPRVINARKCLHHLKWTAVWCLAVCRHIFWQSFSSDVCQIAEVPEGTLRSWCPSADGTKANVATTEHWEVYSNLQSEWLASNKNDNKKNRNYTFWELEGQFISWHRKLRHKALRNMVWYTGVMYIRRHVRLLALSIAHAVPPLKFSRYNTRSWHNRSVLLRLLVRNGTIPRMQLQRNSLYIINTALYIGSLTRFP